MAAMILKACGKHYGFSAGDCAKCAYFNTPTYRALMARGIQYGGTPWSAVIGRKV